MKQALRVLADMYDINESDITLMKSRKYKINEARRIYIYYLWKIKGIKHYRMRQHIFYITHTTSMHHCKRMADLLDNYPDMRARWIKFLYLADREVWDGLLEKKEFTFNEIITPKTKNYENYGSIYQSN